MATDVTGDFELRRFLARFTRTPAGGTQEDDAYIGCHFGKVSGGSFDPAWVAGDYSAVESAFDTLWATLKTFNPSSVVLAEYRWFKSGPEWEPADEDGPYNPAERSTARAVAGTNVSSTQLPPQLALTVTKIVSVRKRWGRVYLPAPMQSSLSDATGRLASANLATILAAWVTFMNSCRTAGKRPVVFSRGKAGYTTPKGNVIGAHAATAYEITQLRMDNLFDVQRRRRWDTPTVRTTTTLT